MSLHIDAKKGEIAESILLPGDPLRAKWIAETYLENVSCYNEVRGMLGYTGTFKGKRISVQGTGMGIPSSMIYFTELIREFGVKNLIRVGSAGSYQSNIKLKDIIFAMSASTNSGINRIQFPNADYAATANFELLMNAVSYANENQIDFTAGSVLSSDIFYEDDPEAYKQWAEYGTLAVEMETAGLYTVAAKYGVNAFSILTVSDSLVNENSISKDAREKSLSKMMEIALNIL